MAPNAGQTIEGGDVTVDAWTPRESVRYWSAIASSADGSKLAATFALIVPDWPAPPNVQALMTTRNGGFSTGLLNRESPPKEQFSKPGMEGHNILVM